MDSFPKETILSLCAKYGPVLNTPAGLDGVRLMAAFAMNESSLGANCTPRYESAYDEGGHYARGIQSRLLMRYGKRAAYSYGPWQILPANAGGFTPDELETNPELAARAFVGFFNGYVIRDKQAKTLEQCGQCYNAGHYDPHAPAGVVRYADDLRTNYASISIPTENTDGSHNAH